MTLTLYDALRCPYCARVRIVMAEKRIPCDTVAIDLDDRPEWIRAMNPPHGRVPVLEEDGQVLPESVVINGYLDERFPEPPLLPLDAGERALARLRIERFDGALGDAYYATRRREEGARAWLELALGELDAALALDDWLTGRGYGLADVAYVPWVLRARDLLGVSLEPFPHLMDWLERMCERPAIAEEAAVVASLPRLV